MFPVGTTEVQLETRRATGVALAGHHQLFHCLSTTEALIPAASPQPWRTSTLQLGALPCLVGQPDLGMCECQDEGGSQGRVGTGELRK